jgi:hypothetical protein
MTIFQRAILNASQTNFAFILELMLQPTVFLENKSITTASVSRQLPWPIARQL